MDEVTLKPKPSANCTTYGEIVPRGAYIWDKRTFIKLSEPINLEGMVLLMECIEVPQMELFAGPLSAAEVIALPRFTMYQENPE